MTSSIKYSLFAAVLFQASAQVPEYFPLHPGNEWVSSVAERPSFGAASESTEVIRVLQNQERQGRTYALVDGFISRLQVLLRLDGDGVLWRWNEPQQVEEELIRFSAARGESAGAPLRGCSASGTTVSGTAETVSTPAAVFDNVWVMRFSGFGPCPGGGVTSEAYVPYIGMVERTEMLTGGGGRSRTWKLVYSRTGGVTQLSEPSDGISLAVVAEREPANAGLPARLRLRGRIGIRSSVPRPRQSLVVSLALSRNQDRFLPLNIPAEWPGGEWILEVQIPFVYYPTVPGAQYPAGEYALNASVNGNGTSSSITLLILLPE